MISVLPITVNFFFFSYPNHIMNSEIDSGPAENPQESCDSQDS